MATFLIRKKATLSSVGIWNSLDNGTSLLQFLEPFKATAKKRGSKKAAASNTIDLPPSKLNNIHHYVRGTWQHGHTATVYDSYVGFTITSKLVTLLHPISDTLARVLYNMHFYEDFEVEEVKQKGLQISRFTPFSVCSIAVVPQQRDGTSWEIMTVKFIEHLSAGVSLDKVDPLEIKYYRLKLAIEGLRGSHIYEHYVVIGIWNLKLCLLILAGAGYTSTILLKNGKLSDLIGELQSLLNGTGEQSEGDFDAIASQVSRLAAEVRQLGWSRQITVLKGNDSQIGLTSLIMPAATLGHWILMYVTKRSMTAAILNLHKHLESVTEAIANTKKHLTKRVQNLDDKLLSRKRSQIWQSALTGLIIKLGSISEKQDVSNLGVFYLVNFVEGKQVEMPQQGFVPTKLKLTGNPRGRLVTYSETQSLMGLKEIAESLSEL
ncbi:hypothetical protein L3X38_008793 [Prunus dulcis]|uniref:DUF1664 domain-containing protein n=1 Tax=Prunus dulcis TaxID=3755 RepID=A0AAD4ZX53_PRUDU|nr:hypothetical protein L3X38_008793 [Prunus dulcis]